MSNELNKKNDYDSENINIVDTGFRLDLPNGVNEKNKLDIETNEDLDENQGKFKKKLIKSLS